MDRLWPVNRGSICHIQSVTPYRKSTGSILAMGLALKLTYT